MSGEPLARHDEPLTDALDLALGDHIRADDEFAGRVWTALANIEWVAPDGTVHHDSFRNASVTVSDIRGLGEDNLWYLAGLPFGIVDSEIADAMQKMGWTHRPYRAATYVNLWSTSELLGFVPEHFRDFKTIT